MQSTLRLTRPLASVLKTHFVRRLEQKGLTAGNGTGASLTSKGMPPDLIMLIRYYSGEKTSGVHQVTAGNRQTRFFPKERASLQQHHPLHRYFPLTDREQPWATGGIMATILLYRLIYTYLAPDLDDATSPPSPTLTESSTQTTSSSHESIDSNQ
jgi:hypothetical protein